MKRRELSGKTSRGKEKKKRRRRREENLAGRRAKKREEEEKKRRGEERISEKNIKTEGKSARFPAQTNRVGSSDDLNHIAAVLLVQRFRCGSVLVARLVVTIQHAATEFLTASQAVGAH